MPHCTKCGVEVPASTQFCPNCGQTQPATPVQPAAPWRTPAPTAGAGMSENTAATLSYVLGWITGIIFFLIDKRPYVRFHAAQSIVTFGGLHVLRVVLGMIFGFGFFFGRGFGHWGYGALGGFGLGLALLSLLGIITFILWIVCMIKAAQGERYMVPIAGEIAQNLAGP
jgi:uncharacterized membrane protein